MGVLDGKVALITGGGKGIGRGIALCMAKENAKVVIGCHSSPDRAAQTLADLRVHTEAELICSDVSTEEGCKALVDGTVRAFGKIDILVNNAALQTHHTMLETDTDIFDKILRTNTRAAFFMMRTAIPYLKQSSHGRIIVISSVHGKRPTDFDACYSISKGALKMLYREAALEFAKYGVTVNTIAPGGICIEGKSGRPKPFSVRHLPHTKQFAFNAVSGQPEDVGTLAVYIASEQSDHLSGATIRLDRAAMLS